MYVNSHFVITTAFLVWLYLRHNDHFYFVRNMFMVAMALALIGYLMMPTAPPRFLPELGFVDTIAYYANVQHDSAFVTLFFNPYAAVPSMHVAFSLMIAVPAMLIVRPSCRRCSGRSTRAGDVRRDRDRQPLVVRRAAGAVVAATAASCAVRVLTRLGRKPGPGAGLASPRPDGRSHPRARPRRTRPARGRRTAAERRAPGRRALDAELRLMMRDRLIESRLTPNAISMTGLVLNVAAAVLVTQRLFFLAGLTFVVGSLMDTLDGRYSRMSGEGHAVRGVPRLHARPDRGGDRAHGRRGLLRRRRATSWRWPRPSWPCSAR